MGCSEVPSPGPGRKDTGLVQVVSVPVQLSSPDSRSLGPSCHSQCPSHPLAALPRPLSWSPRMCP